MLVRWPVGGLARRTAIPSELAARAAQQRLPFGCGTKAPCTALRPLVPQEAGRKGRAREWLGKMADGEVSSCNGAAASALANLDRCRHRGPAMSGATRARSGGVKNALQGCEDIKGTLPEVRDFFWDACARCLQSAPRSPVPSVRAQYRAATTCEAACQAKARRVPIGRGTDRGPRLRAADRPPTRTREPTRRGRRSCSGWACLARAARTGSGAG